MRNISGFECLVPRNDCNAAFYGKNVELVQITKGEIEAPALNEDYKRIIELLNSNTPIDEMQHTMQLEEVQDNDIADAQPQEPGANIHQAIFTNDKNEYQDFDPQESLNDPTILQIKQCFFLQYLSMFLIFADQAVIDTKKETSTD
eukprot:TRINITY_DN9737_c0_g1_i1.p1 TRINITY_DN9737_c0_g1~~TRINITY_DN9737_c0_g1_i1.p1  ORF type:complete len:146 (-),score=16.25 TRINITY_DN9737_c0_g1_i1:46-483(-)